MSRLGDLLRLERTRQGLTHKQVARKCGVSEGFLRDVENGTRIIRDDEARRILRTMGVKEQTEADFTLDDIASTVDLQSAVPRLQSAVQPVKKKAEDKKTDTENEKDAIGGSIWLDALSGILKHVPVYNAVMKEIDHRLLPVNNGKIEGANPDKVFYFAAPDNQMQGFRIRKGDYLLVVPASSPVDGAIMLIQEKNGCLLRKVKLLERFQVMLQQYDSACESEIMNLNEVKFMGRCVRLEAELK